MNTKMLSFLAPIGAPPSPLESDEHGANYTIVQSKAFFHPNGPVRMDSEFYRKEYGIFADRCAETYTSVSLGQYYELRPGRVLPGNDRIPLFKQGMLTNAGLNWSAVSSTLGTAQSVGQVQEDDIVLACTAHEIYYVGRKVDYVRGLPDRLLHNQAVPDLMILKAKREKPRTLHGAYIAAFLRSPSGLHQVQRCIRGLRGGHVYKDDLSHYVLVPLPDSAWLEEFECLSKSAETRRWAAKKKMEQAVTELEIWIRKESHLDRMHGRLQQYVDGLFATHDELEIVEEA